MAKIKRHPVTAFLRSSGVTATAVVMLCVSLGAVLIPGIFANTASGQTPSVSNVQATPGNGREYGVTINWDGYTNNNWIGQSYRGQVSLGSWSDTNKQHTIRGLVCGVSHTFMVAAGNANGGAATNYKSATATPKCPSAAWDLFANNGNVIATTWHDSAGFSEQYNFHLKVNGGAYSSEVTSSTNKAFTGSCGTTYAAYLTAGANGQWGPASETKTLTTPACASPPPSGGGGGSTGGGSTGGSTGGSSGSTGGSTSGGTTTTTSGSSTTAKKKTTTAKTGTAAPVAPDTPNNFAAEVISTKIIELTWDAAANADHYIVRRSIDQTTWQDLTTTNLTSYDDESAAFSVTYYYQLQAVGADGQLSSVVTTQATTDAFSSSTDVIVSQDKQVTIKIPEGAIDGDYNCTLSTGQEDLPKSPTDQKSILGPYDLLCVTNDGVVIDEFNKPLTATMKLATVAHGYQDFTARTVNGSSWQTLKSTYDASKQQINFSLTSAKTFGAFGKKHSSPLGIIMLIFFLLLLVAGAIYGFLVWRRRTPTQAAAVQSEMSAEQEFKQALAQPDCSHLDMARQVIPSSAGCLECEAGHTQWKSLRICLICGHVGCSDDSDQQHALKHYQQTGHPLIYDYANPAGNSIGWCYIDQTYI
jgi:hypothetical protein